LATAKIQVEEIRDGEYRVTILEGKGRTSHLVRVSPEEQQRFGGDASPEELVEQSIEFLLEREPKESILQAFDLSVIERYFPDYGDEIQNRLD
jgi:hypothetical protein